MISFDAIIVLSGGINDDGSLFEWTRTRCDKAIELFSGNEFIIVSSAGTVHKPFKTDSEGFCYYEANAMADYIAGKGIPKDKILVENLSLDTIGNAYFTRTVHTDPAGLRKLCIITSEVHMPRAKSIFEHVFALDRCGYELEFVDADDGDMDDDVLRTKQVREKNSLDMWDKQKVLIKSMEDLHGFMFRSHKAYTYGKKRDILSKEDLKTY